MSGTGDEWQNPIADSTAFEVEPTPPQHSMLSAITLNQGQLSEDDLVDLTYAFQAADMSKEGKLNFEEFQFMLDVMGCDLEADRARQLMADAKADFAAWLRTTDDNTRTECKKIWDAYDKDKNGVLDTDEINAIIVALQNQGFTPKALAKREQETDWEFEQFCAWFVAEDSLNKFKVPSRKMRIGLPTKRTGQTSTASNAGSMSAAETLLGQSSQIHKRAKHSGAREAGVLSSLTSGSQVNKLMREAMADPDQLIFAEYAFMIRGDMLSTVLGNDKWHAKVEIMVKLREAFDQADIDCDEAVEESELEFMVMNMNVNSDISDDVVKRLWTVLNPDGKDSINFQEFLKGMIGVQKDPQLAAVFPVDAPNRFELLSLVIDAPTDPAESELLYQKMNPLEKAGVRILQNLELEAHEGSYNALKARQIANFDALEKQLDVVFDIPRGRDFPTGVPESIEVLLTSLRDRNAENLEGLRDAQAAEIKEKVREVCEGKLHYLTPQQRSNVTKLHYYCVLQAFLIGTVFTIIPNMAENFLCYYFETDGLIDAYWTCPYETRGAEGGGRGPDLGDTEWIGGSFVAPLDVIELPPCPYGTCASVPDVLSDIINRGGSEAAGGTWTNVRSDLSYKCTIADPWPEDCPQMTHEDCPERFRGIENHTCPEDGQLRARVRQKSCLYERGWPWCSVEDFGEHVGVNCSPLPPTPLNSPRLWWWWALNVVAIVVGIVFELSLLMYTALRSAVQVSEAVGLRLIPLNRDRAFVAEMLVRAAFEMGDPQGEMLGINTEQDEEEEKKSHKLRTFLLAVWYKGKAIITGVLLKQVCVRVTTYDTAMWLKPYFGVTVATVLWDGMTCHSIMKGAELRAIGVTTSIEVFNEIILKFFPGYVVDTSVLSEKARVQLLRAIGVAIVKKGAMFPTMELLLRHALEFLQMKRKASITTSGVLDNEDDFIKDMGELSPEEARAVLCVLMLCFVLDGSIGKREAVLWRKVIDKVESTIGSRGTGGEQLTVHKMLVSHVVCQRFRNNQPVTCDLLVACFDPKANSSLKFKTLQPHHLLMYLWREFTFSTMNFLVNGKLS